MVYFERYLLWIVLITSECVTKYFLIVAKWGVYFAARRAAPLLDIAGLPGFEQLTEAEAEVRPIALHLVA